MGRRAKTPDNWPFLMACAKTPALMSSTDHRKLREGNSAGTRVYTFTLQLRTHMLCTRLRRLIPKRNFVNGLRVGSLDTGRLRAANGFF